MFFMFKHKTRSWTLHEIPLNLINMNVNYNSSPSYFLHLSNEIRITLTLALAKELRTHENFKNPEHNKKQTNKSWIFQGHKHTIGSTQKCY